MEKLKFKKGDLVSIKLGYNASDFNFNQSWTVFGPYIYDNIATMVFKIEGTVKLITFNHDPKVYGAYLLTFNDVPVGYVYNTGITLITR